MKTSIIVVGAGLSGLCAAIECASRGASVQLFEKSNQPGGRARTTKHLGASLNLGAHALYREGELQHFCNRHKIELAGGVPKMDARFAHDDALLDFPSSPLGMLLSRDLSLAEKALLVRWLTSLKRRAKLRLSVSKMLADIALPKVRTFLETAFMLTTYCSDFERMPSQVAVQQLTLASSGVRYLDGGFQSLVDALFARAQTLGVHFIFEKVTGVSAGIVQGVDDQYRADHIIIATPQKAAKSMVEEPNAWPTKSPAISASVLDVVLETAIKPRLVLSRQKQLYFSMQSTTAKLCDDSQSVVHVVGYAQQSRAELESFLCEIEPDAPVAFARYLPKLNVQDRIPIQSAPALEVLPKVFVVGPWGSEERLLCDAAISNLNDIIPCIFALGSRAYGT